MSYIINPSVFYWIGVAESIETAAAVFLAVSTVALICMYIAYFVDGEFWEEKGMKRFKTVRVFAFIIFAVSFLAVIFAPSKTTLIEMTVAKYATYDNAEWTIDAVKSLVDYIVESIKTLGA